MNRILIAMTVVTLAGTLAACDRNPPEAPAVDDDAVATVNGESITQAQLSMYAQRRGPEADRADLLNDLVSIQLLAQAAQREGLDRRPEVAGELAAQRAAILAQAAVRQRLEAVEVTDEQVEAEYQRFIDEELGEELHARHILVADPEQAQALIDQLDDGADFARLAREHSSDGSAPAGGDLGWFEPGMMVEPFGQVASELEVGSHTRAPVQTRFGWHVIKLEGRRSADPPDLAEIRDEVRGFLQSRMVEQWVEELRDEATIELY